MIGNYFMGLLSSISFQKGHYLPFELDGFLPSRDFWLSHLVLLAGATHMVLGFWVAEQNQSLCENI